MITYLYEVCTSECQTKTEREKKVLESMNFLKGQMSDEDLDNSRMIGIPINGDSKLGILFTDQN